MNKAIRIDSRLNSYRSFFDHDWFAEKTEETKETVLHQPVFDLGLAWRCVANTHVLPWLLATMVQDSIQANLNTTEPFGKKYISGVRDILVSRLGDSVRPMLRKRIQAELEGIYTEICVIAEEMPPHEFDSDTMWQQMLNQREFQFALIGSQRLCYGAMYYAYEDFITRCIRNAQGRNNLRLFKKKDVERGIVAEFGQAVCEGCWNDVDVHLARVTRHAMVHNGCRVTEEFKQALKDATHPLLVEGNEIQIMAVDTVRLFQLLKDRVDRLIAAARSHRIIAQSTGES